MGCGVHFYVEVLKDSKWELVCSAPDDGASDADWDAWWDGPLGIGQDYMLFGFLAGVRADPQIKLDPPRGTPKDASKEYKRIARRAKTDPKRCEHSHSWYTLKELLDFDWLGTCETGWTELDFYTYRAWLTKGGDQNPYLEPSHDPYSTFIERERWEMYRRWHCSPPSRLKIARKIPRFVMDRTVKNLRVFYPYFRIGADTCQWADHTFFEVDLVRMHRRLPPSVRNSYSVVTYRKPASQVYAHFYEEVLPFLKTFGEPDKVRLLFYFDS